MSFELEGSQGGQGFRFRHVDVKGVKDGIEAVKEEGNAGRTLFLAWPDPVGGDAVGDGDRDEFGVRCLEAYEGERVCYVGELGPGVCRTRVEEDDDGVGGEEEEEEEEEENSSSYEEGWGDVFPKGGSSSSAKFQELLREEFDLEDTVLLPNWPPYNAHLTVWKRKITIKKIKR